jgi:hypothetical protein
MRSLQALTRSNANILSTQIYSLAVLPSEAFKGAIPAFQSGSSSSIDVQLVLSRDVVSKYMSVGLFP